MFRVSVINRDVDKKRLAWMLQQLPHANKVEPIKFVNVSRDVVEGYWVHPRAGARVPIKFQSDSHRSCAAGELSLTSTHISTVISEDEEIFLYEDDANLFRSTNPSILIGDSGDPEFLRPSLLRAAPSRLPLSLQRTLKPYWLWPLRRRDQWLVAFQSSALNLREGFQLGSQNQTFGEVSQQFVEYLPFYATTFGSSGTVSLWYSKEAVERQRELLDCESDLPSPSAMERILKNYCAVDEVMNELGVMTVWPAPVATLLPTASINSKLDIRGLDRSAEHLGYNILSHHMWLSANLDSQEFVRKRMVDKLGPSAWTQEDVCEAYLDALVSALSESPTFTWQGIQLGFLAWLIIELLVRFFRMVR